jgi:adenylylsulfate kinase
MGQAVEMLDGDVMRRHLCKDLGFSRQDRNENIRRIGYVAEILARNGILVIVSLVSPYRAARDEIRRRIPGFIEVYVNAPLQVCELRDVKGLYRKLRAGEIHGVSGIDDPYEAPEQPEVECHTDRETIEESTEKILTYAQAFLKTTPKSSESGR